MDLPSAPGPAPGIPPGPPPRVPPGPARGAPTRPRWHIPPAWRGPLLVGGGSLLLVLPLPVEALHQGGAPPLGWALTLSTVLGYAALTTAATRAVPVLAGLDRWWAKRGVLGLAVAVVTAPCLYAINLLMAVSAAPLGVPHDRPLVPTLFALARFAGIALQEEVCVRGAVQTLLVRRLPPSRVTAFAAIFLASLPWALLHADAGNPWWYMLAAVQLNGLAYGLLRHRFGVRAAWLAHALYDATVYLTG